MYPVSFKCQSSTVSCGVFLFSRHTSLHTYDVALCIGCQMEALQRNQSSVEREVGQQQQRFLDREREMVGGWVTSGQVLAHIAVISLVSASHTDSQPVSHFSVVRSLSLHLLTRQCLFCKVNEKCFHPLSDLYFTQCSAACENYFLWLLFKTQKISVLGFEKTFLLVCSLLSFRWHIKFMHSGMFHSFKR